MSLQLQTLFLDTSLRWYDGKFWEYGGTFAGMPKSWRE
jgi:hypothetical protein